MCTVAYLEPCHIKYGKVIYENYDAAGNIVGVLSDAQRCVRQRGPAGLLQWINCDSKRQFIKTSLEKDCNITLTTESITVQAACEQTELIIRILGAAKYYAKSQKGSN